MKKELNYLASKRWEKVELPINKKSTPGGRGVQDL
jgi:hypothetical protein